MRPDDRHDAPRRQPTSRRSAPWSPPPAATCRPWSAARSSWPRPRSRSTRRTAQRAGRCSVPPRSSRPRGHPALDRGRVRPGRPRPAPRLAFLVVAGVYLLVAGCSRWSARRRWKVGPPERTIRTSKETARFLKNPRSRTAIPDPPRSPGAQTPRLTNARRLGRAGPRPWEHPMVAANGARFHVAVARRRPAGPVPARLPGVLVGLAPPAPGARRGRLPGRRDGPARLRRERQAAPRLRPAHPCRGRRRRDPLAGRAGRGRRRPGSGRPRRVDARGRPSPAGTPPGRRLDAPPPAAAAGPPHRRRQVRASRHVLGYQRPMLPERRLVADDGAARSATCCGPGPGPASPTPTPRRATGRPSRSPASRTARWSPTAGRSGRCRAPTACATPDGWAPRSPCRRCRSTAPSTAASSRPAPRARAATSRRPTVGT